jgi:hypothetical protein
VEQLLLLLLMVIVLMLCCATTTESLGVKWYDPYNFTPGLSAMELSMSFLWAGGPLAGLDNHLCHTDVGPKARSRRQNVGKVSSARPKKGLIVVSVYKKQKTDWAKLKVENPTTTPSARIIPPLQAHPKKWLIVVSCRLDMKQKVAFWANKKRGAKSKKCTVPYQRNNQTNNSPLVPPGHFL